MFATGGVEIIFRALDAKINLNVELLNNTV